MALDPARFEPPQHNGDVVPVPPVQPVVMPDSEAGQAALAVAQSYALRAAAPATLRAYRADWAHYAAWCAAAGFTPVPAAPAAIGAYLASS